MPSVVRGRFLKFFSFHALAVPVPYPVSWRRRTWRRTWAGKASGPTKASPASRRPASRRPASRPRQAGARQAGARQGCTWQGCPPLPSRRGQGCDRKQPPRRRSARPGWGGRGAQGGEATGVPHQHVRARRRGAPRREGRTRARQALSQFSVPEAERWECWRAAGVSRCLSIVRVGSLVGSRSISMRFCVYVRLLTRRKKSEAVASWSSLAYLTSACEVQSNTQATDDAALWLWEAATCSDYQNQTCVKVVSHLGDASASRPGPTPRASPADAQSPEGPVTPLTLWRRHTSSSTAHSAQAP